MIYTLWYAQVPLADISNWQLSGNPEYSKDRIGRFAAYQKAPDLKGQREFFTNLLESIKDQGVRNPVVLVSLKGLHCRYGASRLWACRQLKKDTIPAIVADFDRKWQHGRPLKTEQDVRLCFAEEPEHIVMEDDDFYYYGLPTRD